MRSILVTGGAGFIASALAERLAKDENNSIVVVDNLQTGSLEKLPDSERDNVQFIKCDVNDFNDISAVFYANKFEYVFHYAATVGVQRTLNNPVMVLKDVSGIRNILDLSKNTGVKRVFYSSSSEVYGEPVEIPQNEQTTPLNSRLPYAIVKNLGEAFLRAYQQEFRLDYTIFRFFNTYGYKQSKDFVISKFVRSALAGDDITIYGNGQQTRTFCYIDDNVDACIKAFESGFAVNDVMNVGSNKEITILELAELILQLTDSKSRIVHLPPLAEGDMSRRLPDNQKMLDILNRPLVPLEEGLLKIIRQPEFIQI